MLKMVTKDFSHLVTQNKFQKGYLEHVFKTRNEYKEEAMKIPLKEVWKDSEVEERLLDMIHHALSPLRSTNNMMKDNSLKFSIEKLDEIDENNVIESSLKLYEQIINETEEILRGVELGKLGGNLSDLKDNQDAFIQRYGILTMHAIHHWGQIVKLHGIICQLLENKKKSSG